MRGPKFIEQNVVQKVCQTEQLKQHKYKLLHMQSDTSLSRKQTLQANDKYQQIRANKFCTKFQVDLMKEQQLFRENAKILNRIVDIGNTNSFSSVKHRSVTRQSSASSTKSLNLPYRRKEAMKIVDENQKLMQRLQRTPSTFRNKEAYLRDYKKTTELKNRISKLSQQNKQKMTKLIQNISTSTKKYSETAKEFKNHRPPPGIPNRFNSTAKGQKQVGYENSSLWKLRIGPNQGSSKNTLSFPRIK